MMPAGKTEALEIVRAFSLKDLPDSFYADPYPTYRALQDNDPIHRMADGTLFLTRHRDLEAIYKDTTRFSSDKKIEFAPKYGTESLLYQPGVQRSAAAHPGTPPDRRRAQSTRHRRDGAGADCSRRSIAR